MIDNNIMKFEYILQLGDLKQIFSFSATYN